MYNAISRRSASFALLGGGILLALLLTLVIPGFAPWSRPADANPPGGGSNAPQCASQVHYYAYESPAGWNNFGPDLHVANVGEAIKRFDQKLCNDPLYAATMKEFLANGENLDPVAAQAEAEAFVKNPDAWRKGVDGIKSQVANIELVSIDQRYDSLGMIRGANPQTMPTLTKFAELPLMGPSLKLTLKNGEVRHLRIECDLQPSVPKTFVKVAPPAPAPQPEQPEQPQPPQDQPVCTVNCVPVTPVCTVNCLEAKIPSQGSGPQGHAPVGSGNNDISGPGVFIPGPAMTQPTAVQPAPPAAPAPKPAPVGNEPAPAPNDPGPRPIATLEPAAPAPSEAPKTAPCAPGKC